MAAPPRRSPSASTWPPSPRGSSSTSTISSRRSGIRPDRGGSVEPDLPRPRRRAPRRRASPSADGRDPSLGARHGPRVPDPERPSRPRRCRCPGRWRCARTPRSGGGVLRDGVRRRPRRQQPRCGREADAVGAPRDGRVDDADAGPPAEHGPPTRADCRTLRRPGSYASRQLRPLAAPMEASRTRDAPLVEDVAGGSRRTPRGARETIVRSDFHLLNAIVGADRRPSPSPSGSGLCCVEIRSPDRADDRVLEQAGGAHQPPTNGSFASRLPTSPASRHTRSRGRVRPGVRPRPGGASVLGVLRTGRSGSSWKASTAGGSVASASAPIPATSAPRRQARRACRPGCRGSVERPKRIRSSRTGR